MAAEPEERPTGSGPRRGVGVIVPFDFQVDHDVWAYVGDRSTLHLTRTPAIADAVVSAELAEAVSSLDEVADATSRLTPVTDTVFYACTSGSFLGGNAGERALVDVMLGAGAARAGTTSGGVRDALAELEVSRVAVVTPYASDLTDRLVAFLAENGHTVIRAVGMGLPGDINAVSGDRLGRLVTEVDSAEAEAVFVSCTGLETFELVAPLEAALGKPVLTANQVTMWAALRLVGGTVSRAARRQRLFAAYR